MAIDGQIVSPTPQPHGRPARPEIWKYIDSFFAFNAASVYCPIFTTSPHVCACLCSNPAVYELVISIAKNLRNILSLFFALFRVGCCGGGEAFPFLYLIYSSRSRHFLPALTVTRLAYFVSSLSTNKFSSLFSRHSFLLYRDGFFKVRAVKPYIYSIRVC